MDTKLSDHAVRVLGCLVEKELATPEYYPLSLNGLVSACNQKNARWPLMSLEPDDVADALDQLREAGLALRSAESARVPRYGHNLRGKLHLSEEQIAILGELFLRGPQTSGELRGHASRLHPFPEIADVERVLQALGERAPALVVRLPLQPGHKEQRYAQLLGGDASFDSAAAPPDESTPAPREPARARLAWGAPTPAARRAGLEPFAVPAEPDPEPLDDPEVSRTDRLEEEVRRLRADLDALRREVQELRQKRE
jgi:hypothetical protein